VADIRMAAGGSTPVQTMDEATAIFFEGLAQVAGSNPPIDYTEQGWVKPLCMTETEMRAWAGANVNCAPKEQATSPCEDCTPAFAAEMREQGQCDGEPGKGADPRNVRQGVQNKWADEEWAANRRKQMSEAAKKRNAKPGQKRRGRKPKYVGMLCQEPDCKQQPKARYGPNGALYCHKHYNRRQYRDNYAKTSEVRAD